MDPAQNISLFGFPREVRDIIYGYILPKSYVLKAFNEMSYGSCSTRLAPMKGKSSNSTWLAIFCTSKTVNQEATKVLRSNGTFILPMLQVPQALRLRPTNLVKRPGLRLDWDFYQYHCRLINVDRLIPGLIKPFKTSGGGIPSRQTCVIEILGWRDRDLGFGLHTAWSQTANILKHFDKVEVRIEWPAWSRNPYYGREAVVRGKVYIYGNFRDDVLRALQTYLGPGLMYQSFKAGTRYIEFSPRKRKLGTLNTVIRFANFKDEEGYVDQAGRWVRGAIVDVDRV